MIKSIQQLGLVEIIKFKYIFNYKIVFFCQFNINRYISNKLQRLKILTTPWRDTQQRNADFSSVANGAVRRSFIADEDLNLTKEQQNLTKEQTEVMIQSRENVNGDPPPEPV